MRSNPRRGVLKALAGGSATLLAATSSPVLAKTLAPTPRQSEGPFYPLRIPLDNDNDLVNVKGRPAQAKGETANVVGRVLDTAGRPLAGARVEIWQCDAYGRYHHPGDRQSGPLDENFQAYGQVVTDTDGQYRFRTITPVAYPGRAPHIHFTVTFEDRSLTTQMYVKGARENDSDGLLSWAGGPNSTLVVPFRKNPDASAARLATFDIVLG